MPSVVILIIPAHVLDCNSLISTLACLENLIEELYNHYMRKNVEYEHVSYNKPELANSAMNLVHLFARHSDIPRTNLWVYAEPLISRSIQRHEANPITLAAEGIKVIYSGIPRPILQIEGDNPDDLRAIYKAKDPSFTIRPTSEDLLLPSERLRIYQTTDDILQEMIDVYAIEVTPDPITVRFPKEKYADTIEVFTASLI
jgi:hypothetical protein